MWKKNLLLIYLILLFLFHIVWRKKIPQPCNSLLWNKPSCSFGDNYEVLSVKYLFFSKCYIWKRWHVVWVENYVLISKVKCIEMLYSFFCFLFFFLALTSEAWLEVTELELRKTKIWINCGFYLLYFFKALLC